VNATPKPVQEFDSAAQSSAENRLIGFTQQPSGSMNQGMAAKLMPRVEWIWEPRNRTRTLLASGVIVLTIAAVDRWTKPYFSLGFLYLFPIMMVAGFLPRWMTVAVGIACALLSERFSNLDPADFHIRLGFEALALCGCGLLTSEVLRNRRLSQESQQRIRVLVETSPAAIVTVNERGLIELANNAAAEMLAPRNGNLIGQPIAAFLPELHHALRPEEGPQFRASMQCRGHRGNGESFPAEVWFSTYKEGSTPKLAAIVADLTEEQSTASPPGFPELINVERVSLNNRELEVLRLVVQGLANKEIASRMLISESGVKNTLQQLFAKTEVRTRSQLVRIAAQRRAEKIPAFRLNNRWKFKKNLSDTWMENQSLRGEVPRPQKLTSTARAGH
jgi:PAS domain S-box-containing protein